VLYDSPYNAISGFQFDVDGVSLNGGYGGDAAEAGFEVSTGINTVLGFSMEGNIIPEGSGVLTILNISYTEEGDACLSNAIFADGNFSNINDIIIDDCVTLPCEADCAGVCDGDSSLDDCGVCEGDGESCAVYVEFEITTTLDEPIEDEEELADFEENFEGYMETELGLPEDTVEVLNIEFTELRDVQVMIEFSITLTDEELADTDFDEETIEEDIEESVTDIEEEIDEGFPDFIYGCTDDFACNYDSDATNDDQSCEYAEENFDCEGNFVAIKVQFIHNSANPTVDVYLYDAVEGGDTTLAVPGFEYRTATSVLTLATSFQVGIAPAGGEIIDYWSFFDLEEGSEHVIVATGLLGDDDTPFDLVISETVYTTSTLDVVGLNAYHGSTDAPAVDIVVVGAEENTVLAPDLEYGEFSGYIEVAPAQYDLGIAPSGGDPIAVFSADLSDLGGETAIAFASGFLAPVDDQPAFGLFAALPDGIVIELSALTQDCNGVWGGDTYLVCEDGTLVCDEADCPVENMFSIGFGEVTDSSVEVTYTSNTDIGGFQFTMSGLYLLGASSGAAETAGFTTSVGAESGIVIGFAFDGSTIPAGSGVLTVINAANPMMSIETCLSDIVISDPGAIPFDDIIIGDCASLELLTVEDIIPSEYSLSQNYPNPFNPVTNISFSLADEGQISLKIFDLLGTQISELVNDFYMPGSYNIIWNAV
ncbi:DUF4397 domain-containing protein, partial [Candidatus Marinimicrobia bacterium]|nr:DUF4397 domain-containing protein [Candidatus Neomarinimicrobiota bacterium]